MVFQLNFCDKKFLFFLWKSSLKSSSIVAATGGIILTISIFHIECLLIVPHWIFSVCTPYCANISSHIWLRTRWIERNLGWPHLTSAKWMPIFLHYIHCLTSSQQTLRQKVSIRRDKWQISQNYYHNYQLLRK